MVGTELLSKKVEDSTTYLGHSCLKIKEEYFMNQPFLGSQNIANKYKLMADVPIIKKYIPVPENLELLPFYRPDTEHPPYEFELMLFTEDTTIENSRSTITAIKEISEIEFDNSLIEELLAIPEN